MQHELRLKLLGAAQTSACHSVSASRGIPHHAEQVRWKWKRMLGTAADVGIALRPDFAYTARTFAPSAELMVPFRAPGAD